MQGLGEMKHGKMLQACPCQTVRYRSDQLWPRSKCMVSHIQKLLMQKGDREWEVTLCGIEVHLIRVLKILLLS
jgi:hypothetical protein